MMSNVCTFIFKLVELVNISSVGKCTLLLA